MTIRTTTLSLLTLLTLFPTIAAAKDEPPADGDTWVDHRHEVVANPTPTTLPTPTCVSCLILNGTLTTNLP